MHLFVCTFLANQCEQSTLPSSFCQFFLIPRGKILRVRGQLQKIKALKQSEVGRTPGLFILVPALGSPPRPQTPKQLKGASRSGRKLPSPSSLPPPTVSLGSALLSAGQSSAPVPTGTSAPRATCCCRRCATRSRGAEGGFPPRASGPSETPNFPNFRPRGQASLDHRLPVTLEPSAPHRSLPYTIA